MANYTIFGTAAPEITAGGDMQAVNVGTAFYLLNDVAGWRAAGARFYIPSTAGMPTAGYKAYLWRGTDAATATLLATADFPTVTAGWNQVLFPTAVPLTAFPTNGVYYWVSVFFPGGGYAARAGAFTASVPSTDSSNLAAAAAIEVLPSNGAYAYGAAGLPLASGTANVWYGVDVIVDDGFTDDPTATAAAGTSPARILDTVTAVRTGGPGSTTATAKATDPLGLATTEVLSLPMAGTSIHTVRRSMWQNRTSLSSIEFNDNTLGPILKSGSANVFGVEFRTMIPTRIVGMNIYKHPEAYGQAVASLWSSNGERLASVPMSWTADEGGWREFIFPSPVTIPADIRYVASYYTPSGHWVQNAWVYNGMDFIENPFIVQAFQEGELGKSGASRVGAPATSADIFPTYVFPEGYYVDPIAEWEQDFPKAGPGYYDQFPNGGSSFDFPIAVFYPDPEWLEDYMTVGVNTACGIPLTVASYRPAILAAGCDVYGAADGMTAVPELVQADPELAAHVKGYFLWDEPDMVHNGGTPDQLWDSLAAIRKIDSTRPIVLNLGKWAPQSISYQWFPVGGSVQELNTNWLEYGAMADMMSCDWYTITGVARTGIWCYRKMTGKLAQISHDRIPIWGFVESCPIEGSDPSPEQVQRASWSHLIAGATGIIFFDHRFDDIAHGQGQDFASLLHTPAMRVAVQNLCAEIQSVAGPLKAAPLDLVTNVASSNKTAGPLGGTFGVPIVQTSRAFGSYRYVFAQADRPGATTATFTVPSAAGKTITVLGESRTLTANGSGVFSDAFDNGDYTYHLYRWTA